MQLSYCSGGSLGGGAWWVSADWVARRLFEIHWKYVSIVILSHLEGQVALISTRTKAALVHAAFMLL